MEMETRKETDSSENVPQNCESKTETSNSGETSDKKRKCNSVEEGKSSNDSKGKERVSSYSTFSPKLINSVIYQNNRALGNVDNLKLSEFKKNIIINNLSRFKVCDRSCVFQRRITSIAWHPSDPQMSAAGSKGGDLIMRSLKEDAEDYVLPGEDGIYGSVLGLKFSNTDPCSVYTISKTGEICKVDFYTQNSTLLFQLPIVYHSWFTCLDICYNRNYLLSGDHHGNSHLLKTSGEKVWKIKKFHLASISSCEFSRNDPNLFVTSSIDETVKLWDLRSVPRNGLMSQPLLQLDFDIALSSACFSPSNHLNLLVTDYGSQLRVYSSPGWTESFGITHPHRSLRHMTAIKAIWHPIEDIIIVGRNPEDVEVDKECTIDFYSGSTGQLLHQMPSPVINIASLNAVNSTGDTLFSAGGHQIAYMKDEYILKGSDSESEDT